MKHRGFAGFVWLCVLPLAALLMPSLALAEPPDLDAADIRKGERELEIDVWRGDHVWLVRPELSVGLTDRLTLQLQTDFGREHGEAAKVRDLSIQFAVAHSDDAQVGLAAEAGVDPSRRKLRGEVFLFGSHEAGPWRADADLGLEQEGRETGFVYAWRLRRALGSRWSAAVEGGGGGAQHFAGATFSALLRKPAVELRLGWLFDLSGRDDLARVGFAVEL